MVLQNIGDECTRYERKLQRAWSNLPNFIFFLELVEINYDKQEENPICRPIRTDSILNTGVLPARSTFIYLWFIWRHFP